MLVDASMTPCLVVDVNVDGVLSLVYMPVYKKDEQVSRHAAESVNE
jgi:stringent starvation protein B